MAEGLNIHHHENLLWGGDGHSWEFPNLEEDWSKKNDDNKNKSNGDGDEKATVDAPPPADAKGKKRSVAAAKKGGGDKDKGGSGDGGGGESDHELHIWTERERRKKMRNMFASLHSLLPHLPQKADKSTIVDEAVQHIKKLQQTFEKLQKRKLERLHGINNNSIITQQNLAITMSREAFLAEQGSTSNPNPLFMGLQYPPVYKTWTSPNVVLNVSGRDAHISVCGPKKACLFTGICFVMEKYKLEVVSAQVSSDRTRCMYMIHTHANGGCDQFPVEEIYRQAAEEIMLWVNS